MYKIKKTLAFLLTVVMIINITSIQAFANNQQLLDLQNVSSKEEMNRLMSEVELFLNKNISSLKFKETTEEYMIPLSNGQYVGVETTLEHLSSPTTYQSGGGYIDANLGSWRYGVKFSVLQGKVDIHIIYYVNKTVENDGDLDFEFTSSGIEGTPAQFFTLEDEEITSESYSPNYCFAEGYVTMMGGNLIPINFYTDLLLIGATNDSSNPHYGEIVVNYNMNL